MLWSIIKQSSLQSSLTHSIFHLNSHQEKSESSVGWSSTLVSVFAQSTCQNIFLKLSHIDHDNDQEQWSSGDIIVWSWYRPGTTPDTDMIMITILLYQHLPSTPHLTQQSTNCTLSAIIRNIIRCNFGASWTPQLFESWKLQNFQHQENECEIFFILLLIRIFWLIEEAVTGQWSLLSIINNDSHLHASYFNWF